MNETDPLNRFKMVVVSINRQTFQNFAIMLELFSNKAENPVTMFLTHTCLPIFGFKEVMLPSLSSNQI